jgi:hypothetical protein
MAAATIGLPVLVVCAGLALRRSTRYFALPPLLGVIAGALAALSASGGMATLAFLATVSIVTVPLALACGLVALIAFLNALGPNAVRNAFAGAFALAASVLVFVELDRPGSEPIRQWVGTVGNISGVARDGMVEDRIEVALDDGRRVTATAIRPVTVVSGPFPMPSFPQRLPLEPERVRVNEHRSVITGRVSYRIAGSRGQ